MRRGKHCYIDLFAGCGGLSLGFRNAGWTGLFAIEKSTDAFETLEYNLVKGKQHFNWPSWLTQSSHNIDEVLEKNHTQLRNLHGSVDLIAGGPPCQGFSTAGKREEGDDRNKLVNSYLVFVKLVKPRIILFENVRGFSVGFKKQGGKRGKPFSEYVKENLVNMGYTDAKSQTIDFSRFGVPQNRKRFIVVATLEGKAEEFFKLLEEKRNKFLASKGLEKTTTLADAISDIERKYGSIDSPDSSGFKAGVYSKKPRSRYQELMRGSLKKKYPDSHRFVNHRKSIIKKFDDIITNRLTNQEIIERYKTKKTSTLLLKPGEPCFTLTTLPDDFVHYSEPRILTVREYARIQSFPDWYEIKGTYTTGTLRRRQTVPRYSQVGNAIPPLFAELCGIVIKEMLSTG